MGLLGLLYGSIGSRVILLIEYIDIQIQNSELLPFKITQLILWPAKEMTLNVSSLFIRRPSSKHFSRKVILYDKISKNSS
jgi:hypothetical protein